MPKSHRSNRKLAGSQIDLKKLYSNTGPLGNLRYSETSGKEVKQGGKKGIPLQTPELASGQGLWPPFPRGGGMGSSAAAGSKTSSASRKRVLEELGQMLSGKHHRSH